MDDQNIEIHKTSSNSSTTKIHILALDGLVNVNSLFTMALFLGIVNANPANPNYTLVGKTSPKSSSCRASSSLAESLIVYHVYSFCSFLFSSLIASALKQAIKSTVVGGGRRSRTLTIVHVNTLVLRFGILCCAAGSVRGCIFLMLALVNLVEIKLGILACHGFYTLAACIPLFVLVPLALILYVCIVLHAFTS